MQTCFSIMPFAPGFEEIDRIINNAAKKAGLEYVRSDRQLQPGSVVAQILRDISRAAVVVADVSQGNPNVFYELGIAHHILGPERVVIITQPADKSPFDIHEFHQLIYTHSKAGRAKLRQELPQALRKASEAHTHDEMWNIVRGRLPRTRVLVRELERLIETAGERGLNGVVIRAVAGLGSMAISNHEPEDPEEGAEYTQSLISERDLIRTALLLGARMKSVLNPPRRFAKAMKSEVVRYERLIGLLEGRSDITDDKKAARNDVAAMKRCEFALTPVPMPNLIIIGKDVAYEGIKRGGTRGFSMTHCETDRDAISELIVQFDQLFDESRREMKRLGKGHPDVQLVQQLRKFFREYPSEKLPE